MSILSGTKSLNANRYLEAVANRNFLVFKEFFNPELPFKAVLPGGIIISSVPDFFVHQAHWFESQAGSFETKIVGKEMSNDLALVHTIAIYKNEDESKRRFEKTLYISCTFRLYENTWYVVHIQNTVLSEKLSNGGGN